jgi:hypothetical protein
MLYIHLVCFIWFLGRMQLREYKRRASKWLNGEHHIILLYEVSFILEIKKPAIICACGKQGTGEI